jgi:luciferase family oxidoreductase group 1
MITISVLDLVQVNEGEEVSDALKKSLELAQHVEKLGYNRYWLAEHHNTVAIASAATSVVIGYIAGGTKTIRVGSGGIMLPNHSPLAIAEQFGTLEALYPGRIDLGLGRAPGTDMKTIRALRKDPMSSQNFPSDVEELRHYLGPAVEGQTILATPGANSNVPLWILGSSTFGAQLAAKLGLPYAFASHFAPASLMPALENYRHYFTPSEQLKTPYAMMGVNVVAADTDEEAQFLFTTKQQAFTNLHRGRMGKFKPPIKNIDSYWSPEEKMMVEHMLTYSLVGSKETIKRQLEQLLDNTQVDELMITSSIYDQKAKLKSHEIFAQVAMTV